MIKLKRHFWLFCGLFFLLIFTTLPLVSTFLHTPENSTWVPINDQYKLCGDDKVYGAMVHEQKENFFNFGNPVSAEIGTYGISIFRELSLKLTLTLGLFLKNWRLLFPVSLVLGVLTNFLMMYIIAYSLGATSFISTLAAWITFLYFRIFSPEFDPSIFSSQILNSQGKLFFEGYNDQFRYVILHSSYILFWPLIFAISHKKTMTSVRWVTLLSLALAGLVYSYQPLVIIGALILFFWTAQLLWSKDYQTARKVLLSSTIALALVSCFGFWSHLNLFLHSPSEALTEHFASVQQPFFSILQSVLINQHFLVLLVLVLLLKGHPLLRPLLGSMLATVFVLKCLRFSPHFLIFSDRILHRGFDTFWLLITLTSLFLIFEKTKFGYAFFTSKKLNAFVFIVLIIPNLIGSERMARELRKEGSYWVPQSQWETYDYIAKNTPPKAIFMAVDFRDSQLLPVYTSANLFFSMPFGSTIKTEFDRFLKSWKYLGYEKSILEKWISTYIDSYFKFRCAPEHNRPSFADSFGYQTMSNILYDPYILKYGDIPMRDSTMTKFTNEFVREVFDELDRADDTEIIKSVDYILISKDMPDGLKANPREMSKSFKVEYENDHHILLKNIKN